MNPTKRRRQKARTVQFSWTREAETDLDFLAAAWRLSRSATVREALRRGVAAEIRGPAFTLPPVKTTLKGKALDSFLPGEVAFAIEGKVQP